MATTSILTKAVRGSLSHRALTRISSSQPKRGAAVLAETQNAIHGQQLGHTAFKFHHPVATANLWPEEFWRSIPVYENVPAEKFTSYRWGLQIKNTVEGKFKLYQFLKAAVPEEIPFDKAATRTQNKEDFLVDVIGGISSSTMSIRITPYVLSRINWKDPRNDPVFSQFIPLQSKFIPDHPKLTLDSLHETADSPVPGLVHRYPDKALFLATSVCPTYCNYCTRCYAVGADTLSITKTPFRPGRKRWDQVFAYIEATPQLQDIVISGGDSYYLQPDQIKSIGNRLIDIPHVRRFRYASKGLAVAPGRLIDPEDEWADALIEVSNKAKKAGKSMALHTHFNHPNEFSWMTEMAAQRLNEAGVTVRNQSVLLKGVNDNVDTMSTLLRSLANNNIIPYYVYICDMVKMNEHRRTTLQAMLDLEAQLLGSIAGFMMPKFVVDLPGGGGKRPGSTFTSYDRKTGVSKFVAPAVTASGGVGSGREKKPQVFEYYDPVEPAE
ncbi:L-lysine 2,3-aminomutase [Cytospora mali]|uniref:L-lysine 2,3-aminomutase n=1 Tax=Cytospora mali TaxID=578113 RepID=A0A194VUR0_CYTMA|nr:L-lysine 2,3-aminomutase [Valsa mali]